MNFEYFRPENITQAASLLEAPSSIATYGLNPMINNPAPTCIVDLQQCCSTEIAVDGSKLVAGSCATLQSLLEAPSFPPSLAEVTRLEDRQNLRNMRSIADVILYGDAKSPLLTALLALDAHLTIHASSKPVPLGDFLAGDKHGLITEVTIPLDVQFAFHSLRRTPQDIGIVIAALSKWKTGRVRLALGGFGLSPSLVVDGIGSNGIELAASSAYGQAVDPKASAEYRAAMAKELTLRCTKTLVDLAG